MTLEDIGRGIETDRDFTGHGLRYESFERQIRPAEWLRGHERCARLRATKDYQCRLAKRQTHRRSLGTLIDRREE